MATMMGMIRTLWRQGLAFREAPPCSARYLLGTRRLASLSTPICRVDHSDGRSLVPVVVARATTDPVVVGDADGARARARNASLFDFACHFARQLHRCVC